VENQGPRLVGAVFGTILLAWLAARVTHPLVPMRQSRDEVGAPASWSEGVTYAEVTRREEPAPVMAALELPHGERRFGLPSAPTRGWALRHLCQADPLLWARLGRLSEEDLKSWTELSGGCDQASVLCARASAAADAGLPLSPLERALFPPLLSSCSPASLGAWLDAGWLPLEARAEWVEHFGSTEKVDEELLSALEAQTDGGEAFLLLGALSRAAKDDAATRRLIAIHQRGGRDVRWIEYALLVSEAPSAAPYLESLCAARDAGWCQRPPPVPTDLVELASGLTEGRVFPWRLVLADGGVSVAFAAEALATCALSGKPAAASCLQALVAVDWKTAHDVAQRIPSSESGLLARFPRQGDFESALARCAVDAGSRVSPFAVAESCGLRAWPGLDPLWAEAGDTLAEVPQQERRANQASDRTLLTAWSGGERLDVSLPPGCNPSTHEASTGLANLVLRSEGSPLRFYALRDGRRGGVALFLMDRSRANCLFDGGLLEPLPASLLHEAPAPVDDEDDL
jgi:hypothetical protein